MKKIIKILTIILVTSLSLVACKGGISPGEKPNLDGGEEKPSGEVKVNYKRDEIFSSKDLLSDITYFKLENIEKIYKSPLSKTKDIEGLTVLNYDFGNLKYDIYNNEPISGMPYEIEIKKNIGGLSPDFLRGIKIGDRKEDIIKKFPAMPYRLKQKAGILEEAKYASKVFNNDDEGINDLEFIYIGEEEDYAGNEGIKFVVGYEDSGFTMYSVFLDFLDNKLASITINL